MICPAEPRVPFEGERAPERVEREPSSPPPPAAPPGGGGSGPRRLPLPPATPAETIGVLGLGAALAGAALGAALGVETASFNDVAFDPRSLFFVTLAGSLAGAVALSIAAAPLVAVLALLAAAGKLGASAATLRAGALSLATFAILVQVVLFADPEGEPGTPVEFGAADALCVGLFVLFAALLMAALFLYGRAHWARRTALAASGARKKHAAPSVAFPSRFAALGAALTLFLLLAVSAVSSPPRAIEEPSGPGETATAALAPRLVVIGIDGLSPQHLDDAIRAGAAPTLARFRRDGFVTGCAPPPRASRTASWVTVLTGRRPDEHGVRADAYCEIAGLARPLPLPPRLPAGLPARSIVSGLCATGLARSAPASASLRSARTVVERLRDHGVSAVEVAFPAADARRDPSPAGSAVVADEAIAPLREWRRFRGGAAISNGPFDDARRAALAPAAVAGFVEEATRRGEAEAELEFRAFSGLAQGDEDSLSDEDPLDVLLALSRADGASAAIGESLARALAPRVIATRLPAFGAVVRALEDAGVPVRLSSSESAAALAALRAADRLVARLEASAGAGANVIVVSDRGDAGSGATASAPAVFLAYGPDVRPGGGPGVAAETLDVAPTVLYLAGARPPAGAPGRVIGEALSETLLRERPIVPRPAAERRP